MSVDGDKANLRAPEERNVYSIARANRYNPSPIGRQMYSGGVYR